MGAMACAWGIQTEMEFATPPTLVMGSSMNAESAQVQECSDAPM